MAFNVQTFKTRALTSIIFVLVMLAGLWWNVWSFAILFATIHFGCWFEFVSLARKISASKFPLILAGGLIYITMPVMLMLDLRMNFAAADFDFKRQDDFLAIIIPTGIIFSIWINDTMAYIVGSFIGKTPFSKISPKKTWEGTIGGAIFCVAVIGLAGYLLQYYSVKDWLCIAAICAIAGTAGDLFESKLKRLANVKDSGNLMPGHGGFLDRFDSMLWAVPFVWIYVKCGM